MEYIITLHLNETGKKALGTNTKVLYTNVDNNEIHDNFIDERFPIALVDHYEVSQSFLSLKNGDNVCVVDTDGNQYIGEVSHIFNKRICVHTLNNINGNGAWFDFNPDGVEATHRKRKLHIEFISDEELEKLKNLARNKPYIDLIVTLLGTNDKIVNVDKLKTPDWLSLDTIKKIQDLVSEDLHVFDENC